MKRSLPILKLRLSEFGERCPSWADADTVLYGATAFAIDSTRMRERAAKEEMPWPTWLASLFLTGFAEEPAKKSALVGYRFLQRLVVTYCLTRSTREFEACYKLIEELVGMETGMQGAPADMRPLVYWDGAKQTAHRLFPFPLPQKKRRGQVLHIDHGNLAAFFSSYVDPIWPGIWKTNLLEYSDYEVIPEEKESYLTVEDKRIRYQNAFAAFEAV